MANCTNCGTELAQGARICQVCGSPVSPAQPPPPPPAQQWPPPPQQPPYQGEQQPPPQGGYQVQYGYGQPQQFPGGMMTPPRTDGQAIAALVCGIIGIVACPVIFSIIAIVLGKQSEKKIKESGGVLIGDQMAKAGWILGIVGLILGVVWLVMFGIIMSTAMTGF